MKTHNSSAQAPNGQRFAITVDMLDNTSMHKPDAQWLFTDAAGHPHQWQGEKLPTLRWVIDIPETDEYPAQGHYECALCGVYGPRITPRHIASTFRSYVPGMTHYYVDGSPVDRGTFIIAAHLAGLPIPLEDNDR